MSLSRPHGVEQGRGGAPTCLSTLVSYPERGPWGDAAYRGNCTGHLLRDLLAYYQPRHVLDPMEGSGTSRDVCSELGVAYSGADLQGGAGLDLYSRAFLDWTRTLSPVDFVFWHPPYGPMIRYSDHPRDISTLPMEAFRRVLVQGAQRLFDLLVQGGHLVVLIGIYRKDGQLVRFHSDLMAWRPPTEPELIKAQHHCESDGRAYTGRFIPIRHEYVLIWEKPESRGGGRRG